MTWALRSVDSLCMTEGSRDFDERARPGRNHRPDRRGHGFQEVRARRELQRILQAYVQAELRPWIKMFPDEFFEEIYGLEGWEYRPGTSKRTPYVGKLVNRYVYEQLPPGVLDNLRRPEPKD
jgi:hypothetical protein